MIPREVREIAERLERRHRKRQEKLALECILGVEIVSEGPIVVEPVNWKPLPVQDVFPVYYQPFPGKWGDQRFRVHNAAKTVSDHLGEDVSLKRAIALAATEEVSKEDIAEYLLVRGLEALAGDTP